MGIRRFVYISSAEVYGRPQACPVKEDHRLEARSPYAAAKIAAENLVETLCRAHQINTSILRPFSVYGPGQSRRSLLATIMRQIAIVDNDVIRLQNLSPVRDYCYVDDVAQAIVLAAGLETTGLMVCNIGTSIGTSVSELAREVLRIVGRNLDVVEAVGRQRPPDSEIYSLIANRRAAADSLGWSPRIALREGLVKTIRQLELQR
jgi:nucleoside-diphosphate-sugar epimerase